MPAFFSASAEENVVFIRDGGTGDGSTAQNALGNAEGYETWVDGNTCQKSALVLAVEKLRSTGGTIVVCGPTTILYGGQNESDAKNASDFVLPNKALKKSVKIRFTSVYGGKDYRTSANAAIVVSRTTRQAVSIEMNCSSTWENITLRAEFASDATASLRNYNLGCGGFPTVIGEGVVCESYKAGKKISPSPENANLFPLLTGGKRYKNVTADADVTVLSGTWQYVCAGSTAFDRSSLERLNALTNRKYGVMDGKTTLTFGGNAVSLTGVSAGSFSDGGLVTKSTSLTITGGIIYGEINSAGNGGLDEENTGSVCKITGGNLSDPALTILSVGGTALYAAPNGSILDLTALPSAEASRLAGLSVGFTEIRAPQENADPSETDDSALPEDVISYLLKTETTKKDYSEALSAALSGNGETNVLSLLKMLQPAEPDPLFDVAFNTDVIRMRTIDYFNRMSEVEWVCGETMDFSGARSYTSKLIYQAGETYYGLPYTSATNRPGACIQEFLDSLNDSLVYTGPKTYDALIGGDCGSMRRAWAWGGAITGVGMTYDCFEMFEHDTASYPNRIKGIIVPLDGVNFDHYDYYQSTKDCILAYNSADDIYEAYGRLQAADLIGHRFPLSGKIEQHVRLLVEDATVVRSAAGKIIPSASYIVFSEQTSTPRVIDGKNTTWNLNVKITFSVLYADGYVPMTTAVLAAGKAERPQITFDDRGRSGKNLIGMGKVTSNYNIFQVDAVFTNAEGKVVSSHRAYPYGLEWDISSATSSGSIYSIYRALPSGSYTYTLTATIGPGTKTLCTVDFEK